MEPEAVTPTVPVWAQEIASRLKAENFWVFLLHGDITCLVPNPKEEERRQAPYLPLPEFLLRVFDGRKMVIFYNIASGPRFSNPEMEATFRKIAELEKEGSVDPAVDPVAAAKASLAAKRPTPREPELCLPLIEKVLKKMENVAVVIESVHFMAPESSGGGAYQNERVHIERFRNWAQDSSMKRRNNVVLLMTDIAAKVSGELRQAASRISSIFIPKPSPVERKRYLERLTLGSERYQNLLKQIKLLEKKRVKYDADIVGLEAFQKELKQLPKVFTVPDDFKIDAFVNATQGMSLRQILEIFRIANQTGRPVDLVYVKEKKQEILSNEYGDVMEICEPQWSLDEIGGLAKPKAHFQSILSAIQRAENRLIPQGITIMGPPGTGKTALVEALAKGASFNFVKMKNARSMWVGQSEERTERQIQGLWALAPVIIMNDEADLGEANRESPKGDSGVSERIMGAWMKFLSDPRIRGKVIMVNCTNRPDRMDAALKRSGRSDDRLAILMPSIEERAAIFQVMFKRYNILTSITDFNEFARLSDGISGADIESISLKAFRFADELGQKEVTGPLLIEAIQDFIPSASQAEIDLMTLLAISESSSRRLLPANAEEIVMQIKARNLASGCTELIKQIEARNIVKLPKASTVVTVPRDIAKTMN